MLVDNSVDGQRAAASIPEEARRPHTLNRSPSEKVEPRKGLRCDISPFAAVRSVTQAFLRAQAGGLPDKGENTP
jgi:hypothetical protein